MTDFGRRVGDMLKSDYDVNEDDVVDQVIGHHESHESGEDDEIDCTGLTGAVGPAILGDGTAGRVLRQLLIGISNGTNDYTLKCNTFNRFNHTPISTVDNIPKNATTSGFTLDSGGTTLTIEASILEGNVLMAIASIYSTATGAALDPGVRPLSNDIVIVLSLESNGVAQDITDIVDAGNIYLTILYITDA